MPPPYCIGEFRASWWARPPYLSNSSKEEPAGLFRDLLLQVVAECCNNCSQLKFDAPLNGSFELEALIEANSTDFGCPLYGAKDQTYFRGFPFMPVGKFIMSAGAICDHLHKVAGRRICCF